MIRSCKQTVVYWGNPVATGIGGFTFDAPVEIKGRWEDKSQLILDNNGKEIISKSRVYLLQDVDEQGYLLLGDLNDLSSNPANPRDEDGAFEIKRFHKSPALQDVTQSVRTAYLSQMIGG